MRLIRLSHIRIRKKIWRSTGKLVWRHTGQIRKKIHILAFFLENYNDEKKEFLLRGCKFIGVRRFKVSNTRVRNGERILQFTDKRESGLYEKTVGK